MLTDLAMLASEDESLSGLILSVREVDSAMASAWLILAPVEFVKGDKVSGTNIRILKVSMVRNKNRGRRTMGR